MSRHGTLLPIPEGSVLADALALTVRAWEAGGYAHETWPRSVWLRNFEQRLRSAYPESTSADRKLTARHYAPFPMALGPNFP